MFVIKTRLIASPAAHAWHSDAITFITRAHRCIRSIAYKIMWKMWRLLTGLNSIATRSMATLHKWIRSDYPLAPSDRCEHQVVFHAEQTYRRSFAAHLFATIRENEGPPGSSSETSMCLSLTFANRLQFLGHENPWRRMIHLPALCCLLLYWNKIQMWRTRSTG